MQSPPKIQQVLEGLFEQNPFLKDFTQDEIFRMVINQEGTDSFAYEEVSAAYNYLCFNVYKDEFEGGAAVLTTEQW